jgi:HD-GYP domain-containing protein (c-di-GMP phosphodiesterase class II)
MSRVLPPTDVDRAEAVCRAVAAALSSRRIYARGHTRYRKSIRDLLHVLKEFFGDGEGSRFRVLATGGLLLHQGIPLGSGKGAISALARLLEAHQCGGLIFSPRLTEASLGTLLDWLSARAPAPPPFFEGIEVLPPGMGDHARPSIAEGVLMAERIPEFELAHQIQRTAASVLENVMDDMRDGRDVDFKEIVELTDWTAEAAYELGTKLVAPARLQSHDRYTFNHSVNVFLISTTLLQPFARTREELARFSQAALLHDVGKARVPREILHKKGALTPEEFAVIQRHPEYGAEILQCCPHTDPLAVEVAYCHHMRDDGLGYPEPQVPVRPGPIAAIVQVADMFEALTAERPYHDGLSTAAAVRKILSTPGMDSKKPAIVLLLERLTNSPPGSEVRLSGGELGIVLETFSETPHLPRVRITEDAKGEPLAEPYDVDLRAVAAPGERPVRQVFLKPSRAYLRHETAARGS